MRIVERECGRERGQDQGGDVEIVKQKKRNYKV